jgi:phenylpropionate dioxygenase-like ring-hydroxylating dioxygenase large terminal subunit
MVTADEMFTLRDHVYVQTAPGTIGGRFLRQFWQPVYHSVDLERGRATPLRIMSQDFTLYRGESGTAVLIDPKCPHRAAQMSIGRVESDAIRCFYHGWKFGADGACLEQPRSTTIVSKNSCPGPTSEPMRRSTATSRRLWRRSGTRAERGA